jgi:SAM-dependent methyltransferase
VAYQAIVPGGASTGAALNLQRRLALVDGRIGLRNKHVADLGCGQGDYVRGLLAFTPDVVGVEYSESAVELYRSAHPGDQRVELGDIQRLRFADESFDVVLLNEVLEHVPDDRLALREARRVLRPDGHLVIFSPNRLHPFETHGADTLKGKSIPVYAPFLPYVPLSLGRRFVKYRARNYWPSDLRRLLRAEGFDVQHHTFVWQTFENISGAMPSGMSRVAPALRAVSMRLERTPALRRFGVSQLLVARIVHGVT